MLIAVHSIIPCDINERAKEFYASLFPNWRFEPLPPNEFWEITDKDGDYPHDVYLAMMKGPGTPAKPVNYYVVDSIDEAIERAVSLGGKIIVPKTKVPGVGYYSELLDVIENNFGLWQDDRNVK